ncbi:sporulation phosphorelay system protein KapB [Jeotgalibacillus sp. ET6]|uniref:sporulation phosphorelay system protein KapB n=1 Tax=Jeotgalibacillus sp. ET6 TaxID=3037260 RepID=UPI0024187AD4|nr:sporulation phosphorelay system protein KapB [Jeotgalibacillus sp. ET6]MDG5471806.1 sporulation phosphorelay system protein KapB [Jeotgalibacillus sp. ET6]
MSEIEVGQMVRAFYKTGAYIGQITENKGSHAVVQIKEVRKHPKQGDLHHPNETEVPLFHERKALSFNERANIPFTMIKPFDEAPGDYFSSLKDSVSALEQELESKSGAYEEKSYKALQEVKKEYALMYSIDFN